MEIIVTAALIILLTTMFYTPISFFQKKLYSLQLQSVAQTLAADIRTFQQETLFGISNTSRIVIQANKEGYYIEASNNQENRYVDFNVLGCNGVYFSKLPSSYIRFSNNGAPLNAGTYILKHKMIPKSYKLTIQVSSGRVDLNEE